MKREKGYIIFGFPGIGKSTLANNKDSFVKFIDLESSCFYDSNGNKPDKWYEYYGNIAIDLAKQSNYVFVSTHSDVLKYITQKVNNDINYFDIRLLIVYPQINLKNDWIEKLQKRYQRTQSQKDKKALDRVIEHFEEDINNLNDFTKTNKIRSLIINKNDYDLNDYIKNIHYCWI